MSKMNTPPMLLDRPLVDIMTTQQERCTILHCRFFVEKPNRIRIWPETVLVEDGEADRKLIAAYGIELNPGLTNIIKWNKYFYFTLVFEGLNKNCESFLLYERIPAEGGFISKPIKRNKTDVYHVEVWALPAKDMR